MNDIQSREDIVFLLEKFYAKAMTDDVIGFYFTEIVPLNLTTHIPVLTDFWEAILFDANTYHNNAMNAHKHIHHLHAFTAAHFDRWVVLFHETVNEYFAGNKAELAKQRATSIATVMKIKFIYNGIENSKA